MKNTSLDIELGLPDGIIEDFKPFVIPMIYNKGLLLSDIHAPYHSKEALSAALKHGKKNKANVIILNGDSIDFYMISRHEKDPRVRGIKYELDILKSILLNIRELFPDALIVFKAGNHEERWEAFLKVKAPELLDLSEFRLDVILKLRELKIEYVCDKRNIKHGKLHVLHGHEFPHGMAAPVNPARGFYMRAKVSMIGGHHHQTSEHTEPDLNNNIVTTWSTGCLCDLHPRYMPFNKWNHGFAYNELTDDQGNFRLRNYRIVNGEIL